MRAIINLAIAITALVVTSVTYAATCNGKTLTKTINLNDYDEDENVYLWGTSRNDVWRITGTENRKVYVLFNVDIDSSFVDFDDQQIVVETKPSSASNGGNDSVCIINESAETYVSAKNEYKTFVDTKSGRTLVNARLSSDDRTSEEGELTFLGSKYDSWGKYIIRGTEGHDFVSIDAGDDINMQVKTYGGNDTITLTINENTFSEGKRYVHGGSGNDSIWGSLGNDLLIGGSGEDYIDGSDGHDFIIGADANIDSRALTYLTVLADAAREVYTEELITVKPGDNTKSRLYGGSGNDVILGSDGEDTIEGNSGNDWIYSYGGNDLIFLNQYSATGTHFGWSMEDGSASSRINILTIPDNDGGRVYAGNGNDSIWGSNGNDTLYGETGSDFIMGMGGNDTLSGGDCNSVDYLFGMTGSDRIIYCVGDFVALGISDGFLAD